MSPSNQTGKVLAVCQKADPGIPKHPVDSIHLIEDYGVAGDYHAGKLIRHRYAAKKDPTQPNHRHVLLIDTSMLEKLAQVDIHLTPGQMGENLLLDGIEVMKLQLGDRLTVGPALLEVTEIRTPCAQLNDSHPNLFETVKNPSHWAGVFARILTGGPVQPGDRVEILGQTLEVK